MSAETSRKAVDDLGGGHGLAGGDVHVGHVPTNISITNDAVKMWRRHSEGTKRNENAACVGRAIYSRG